MLDNVFINCQSSIKIISDKVLYFDPYLIKESNNDADIIFITHDHYDHFDLESINNIKKKDTIIVVPNSMVDKVSNLFETHEILGVDPDMEYNVYDINVKTIRAYNNEKKFHPKENNWVGYLVYLDNFSYYIMGDTDRTPETDKVKTDICFVPIGGTYTMNVEEASKYINDIKPKKAIPIHYGKIVGDVSLGNQFKEMVDKDIEVDVLING